LDLPEVGSPFFSPTRKFEQRLEDAGSMEQGKAAEGGETPPGITKRTLPSRTPALVPKHPKR